MNKNLIIVYLVITILSACSSQAPHIEEKKYIALSQVARKLSMQVSWKSSHKQAVVHNERHRIIINTDSDTAIVDGQQILMTAPTVMKDQEIFIPFEFYKKHLASIVEQKIIAKEKHEPEPPVEKTQSKPKLIIEGKIVIDAGHGAHDPGATGVGNKKEKNFTLAIARKLTHHLEEAGAQVVMTRDKDVFLTLSRRAEIANNQNADCFVSIHLNAATPAAHGYEIWIYRKKNTRHWRSWALAEAIRKNFIKNVPLKDRGIRKSGFVVLRETTMPAILIECAFLTNKKDAHWISQPENQEILAKDICKGIGNYLASRKK